jgi:hypothetical protein
VNESGEGHIREDVFAAYLDKSLSPTARASVDQHLGECAACRDELVSLTEIARSIGRPRRTLRFGAAAAAIAAVLLIAVVLPRQASRPSSADGERLRETSSNASRRIDAVSPTDSAVLAMDSVRFIWHRDSTDAGYRLVVSDDAGNVAWTLDTPDTSVALPTSIRLKRDRVYFWYVDAIGREGTTRATGLRQFRVAP